MNHFTPKMKKYFTEKFYDDNYFREDVRFQLANRIYQFFKFLELLMNTKIQLWLNSMKKCFFFLKEVYLIYIKIKILI